MEEEEAVAGAVVKKKAGSSRVRRIGVLRGSWGSSSRILWHLAFRMCLVTKSECDTLQMEGIQSRVFIEQRRQRIGEKKRVSFCIMSLCPAISARPGVSPSQPSSRSIPQSLPSNPIPSSEFVA